MLIMLSYIDKAVEKSQDVFYLGKITEISQESKRDWC